MSLIKYRPEVDGLRAVAVIPVVLFHAGIAGFAGGFVGVDIFFVISGYLITLIIYTEIQQQRFSIVNFYERRARRILPALFAVVAVSSVLGWLWMFPTAYAKFAQSVSAVSLFASNIFFKNHAGYFDTTAQLKPMLHTWTLALEEQFYVFFPLMLLMLRRLSGRHLLSGLIALWFASLGLSEYAAYYHKYADFYLLPTRAWELGTGAIIAIGIPAAGQIGRRAVAETGAVVGLALILYAVFTYDSTYPFPSLWALAPVIGSALIIVYARPQTLIGGLLSSRPLVGVGLISYSAYLWHQPILVFTRIRALSHPSNTLLLSVAALSLVIAYLSWRFVEQPFRDKRRIGRGRIFTIAASGSVVMLCFGLVIQADHGVPNRINPHALRVLKYSHVYNPMRVQCHSTSDRWIPPKKSCVYDGSGSATNGGNADTVAIWGDSHAMAVSYKLAQHLKKYGVKLGEFSYAGCLPILGAYAFGRHNRCIEYNNKAYKLMISDKNIKTVVITGRYQSEFEGSGYDNQEGGVELEKQRYGLPIGKGRRFLHDPRRIPELGALARATIQKLISHGKRVVFIYPIPGAGWDVPEYLAKGIAYHVNLSQPLSTSYAVFENRIARTYAQFDKLHENPALLRVRTASVFCNTYILGRCVDELHGKPLYGDNNHVNPIGADMLAQHIVQSMRRHGWLAQDLKTSVAESGQ